MQFLLYIALDFIEFTAKIQTGTLLNHHLFDNMAQFHTDRQTDEIVGTGEFSD
jgi:hypothetical protein